MNTRELGREKYFVDNQMERARATGMRV